MRFSPSRTKPFICGSLCVYVWRGGQGGHQYFWTHLARNSYYSSVFFGFVACKLWPNFYINMKVTSCLTLFPRRWHSYEFARKGSGVFGAGCDYMGWGLADTSSFTRTIIGEAMEMTIERLAVSVRCSGCHDKVRFVWLLFSIS